MKIEIKNYDMIEHSPSIKLIKLLLESKDREEILESVNYSIQQRALQIVAIREEEDKLHIHVTGSVIEVLTWMEQLEKEERPIFLYVDRVVLQNSVLQIDVHINI